MENALKVVDYLSKHPQVEKVNHPSLPDAPTHDLYEKYFPNGGGSIFTFEIKGGAEEAKKFLDQGIKPNTIRLSIGTEHIDDIIDDLEEAFAAVR